MPEAKVNDTVLYFEVHGKGTPLVMIRGVGSNSDHWYAQISAFQKKYQVIIFDNRGIARSSDPVGDFTVLSMAGDTVGLMDFLGIKKAHILGLSMGGMIAQEIAIRYPERVMGLVLVATHCGGTRQIRPKDEVLSIFQEMVQIGNEDAKKKAATVLFDPQTLRDRSDIAEEYAAISLRHPAGPDVLSKQLAAAMNHDAYDRLEQISAPTLTITGASDVLVPPENAKVLAQRIPDSQCIVIPCGGHQVLIEQPERINDAILDFYGRLDD